MVPEEVVSLPMRDGNISYLEGTKYMRMLLAYL